MMIGKESEDLYTYKQVMMMIIIIMLDDGFVKQNWGMGTSKQVSLR